jgi:hypothetical protein
VATLDILDPVCLVPYPWAIMGSLGSPIRLACLLLALLFVGTQLHFCADFTTSSSGSHVCQLCATAGHAVGVQAVVAESLLAISRLEPPGQHVVVGLLSFSLTAPRAPPSL